MRKSHRSTLLAVVSAIVVAGCGKLQFGAAELSPTLETVDLIRNNDALSPQQKRLQLAAYDIDDVTINGLLYDVRLANQFGGDLATAIEKVEAGQMTAMTPDEIQAYGDATAATTYSDEEAQALVDFFADYEIDTIDDLQAAIDSPTVGIPDDVDETLLRNVFINVSLDEVRAELP